MERPLTPKDLLATIYRHLGIDHRAEFQDFSGRPIRILSEGEPIWELIGRVMLGRPEPRRALRRRVEVGDDTDHDSTDDVDWTVGVAIVIGGARGLGRAIAIGLALEADDHGVKLFAIEPGTVRTDMAECDDFLRLRLEQR